MAIAFTDRVKMSERVLISGLQHESMILNLDTDTYFGLDEAGTRFLHLLSSSESIQAAYDTLLDEYEVDPAVLRRDITELLDELIERGLVEVFTE